eukprot:2570863-Amphidinium_carterae.1
MDLVAKNEVWLLKKALYGLREAPKLWQDVTVNESIVHASIWLIVDVDKAVKVLKTRAQLKANRNSTDVLSESQSLIDFPSVDCVEARGLLTVCWFATITWVETLKQPADYLTNSFVGIALVGSSRWLCGALCWTGAASWLLVLPSLIVCEAQVERLPLRSIGPDPAANLALRVWGLRSA